MSYVAGINRAQIMLLPEAIDDYITAGNPVHFIDALYIRTSSRASVWNDKVLESPKFFSYEGS